MNQTDRLSGWKEIADHLRRSVRSAQRWERELGLPVQRVKTRSGHVVYASRLKLDQWMTRVDLSSQPDDPDTTEQLAAAGAEVPTDAPEDAASFLEGSTVEAPVSKQLPVLKLAAVGLGAVLVIAFALYFWGRTAAPIYDDARLTLFGQSLLAHSPSGELLWRHDFGRDVAPLQEERWFPDQRSTSVSDTDLNGDREVDRVVPVKFSHSGTPPSQSDGLFAFTASGRLLWNLTPPEQLSCGGITFRGPWEISAVVVSGRQGLRHVWAAFHHHTAWPSFVMEVLPDGEQHLRYVQAGWIKSLAEWTRPDGTFLAAGGVLNEELRPAIAVVRTDGPPAMLPSRSGEFTCAVDGVAPVEVTTLESFEVASIQGFPYLMTNRLRAIGADLKADLATHAIVTMGADGTVRELGYTDMYWHAHGILSDSSIIKHTAGECPELRSEKRVGRWTPEKGWTEYAVRPKALTGS